MTTVYAIGIAAFEAGLLLAIGAAWVWRKLEGVTITGKGRE
jgi:hypothetical protein